ncbi:MAG: ATP-binding protein [Ketobacteraceae bacterium]|nr:ATP-binding protein [Ketobacteraceae bacterium]
MSQVFIRGICLRDSHYKTYHHDLADVQCIGLFFIRSIICIGIFLCFSLPSLALAESGALKSGFNNQITVTKDQGEYPLGIHLAILEDSSKSLSIEEVSSQAYADMFEPSEKAAPGFGFSTSAYWARVDINQKTDREQGWMLELSYAPMQWIDVYTITEKGEKRHQRGGSGLPFDERPYAHHKHIFELRLPEDSVTTLYVRIDGETSKNLPLRLYRADVFAQASSQELYALGLYFGVVFGLLCYNLFIYYSIREKAYLFYIGFLAASAFFFMSMRGLAQQLLLPNDLAHATRAIPIGMGFLGLFAVLFTMAFIQTRENLPKLHKLLQIVALWSITAIITPLFASYRISILNSSAMGITAPVVLLITALFAVQQGNQSARYYLLAWCLFLTGTFLNTARVFGLVPNNPFTEYAMLWGSAAEAILLSVALAARMRLMKEEKEAAQQLALENQQKALDNLHLMDEIKDEFLANTSHELRTPLNGIIGLAEASLHDPQEPPRPRQKDNLAMIIASGRRLASLVNDILDFSKLRHQDIELSPKAIDARTLGDVVLALSRPLLNDRDIELSNKMPENLPLVWADENRLQQILHNLIGNALKFTERGAVTLNGYVKGQMLCIKVEDTGIGVPEDRVAEIFESFNQGDGGIQRQYGGTGLGLSITKRLVELHGGQITVNSAPAEGSTFSFTLPLAGAKQPASNVPALRPDTLSALTESGNAKAPPAYQYIPSTPTAAVPSATPDRRLLVVDDEPVNRQVLWAQLVSAGFEVVEATDGEAALKHLNSDSIYDLVLLDVMMPRLSGYDTCRILRETFSANQLPVIFLTAKSQTDDILAGFSAGGNDYLVKPFSREELLVRVNVHLNLVNSYRLISDYKNQLEEKVHALQQAHDELAAMSRELEAANADLEQRVDDRTQALQITITELSEAKAATSRFLANMSHELRTPMNAIIGYSEMLSEELAEEGHHHHLPDLNKMLTASRHLLGLINDVLDLSKIEAGKMELHLEPVNLASLVEEVQAAFEPAMLKQGNRLVMNMAAQSVQLHTDATKLRQILFNLLSNAAKFTRNGRITLSVETETHPQQRQVVFKVSDTGIGMNEDQLRRIFDAFAQADSSTTRKYGGTGLGLTISKHFCEMLGGSLTVISRSGKGSTFTVRLPVEIKQNPEQIGSTREEAT